MKQKTACTPHKAVMVATLAINHHLVRRRCNRVSGEHQAGKFKFPLRIYHSLFSDCHRCRPDVAHSSQQYHMAMNEAPARRFLLPAIYAHVEANPQGLISVLMAPPFGLYDPDSGQARAIDVALFILIIGGFLGIVTKTVAIDAGIDGVTPDYVVAKSG